MLPAHSYLDDGLPSPPTHIMLPKNHVWKKSLFKTLNKKISPLHFSKLLHMSLTLGNPLII